MSDHQDADLQALFAQPAPLPDSSRMLESILAEVDRQQGRRGLWLGIAAVTGMSLPLALLAAAVGWPLVMARIAAMLMSLEGLQRGVPLPENLLRASAPYGLWIAAMLGIVATAVAALKSIHRR